MTTVLVMLLPPLESARHAPLGSSRVSWATSLARTLVHQIQLVKVEQAAQRKQGSKQARELRETQG